MSGLMSMREQCDNIEERIGEALDAFDFGETGSAKVERGGLYCRREENADWRFVAIKNGVEDWEIEDATEAIREFFEHR